MTSTQKEKEQESLKKTTLLLLDSREELLQQLQAGKSATSLVSKLLSQSTSEIIMKSLASFLFLSPDIDTSSSLSAEEALSFMGALLSTKADHLRVASQAVLQEAQRFEKATEQKMYLSPMVLQALVSQLQQTAQTQVSENASQVLTIACRQIGTAACVKQVFQALLEVFGQYFDSKDNKSASSTILVRCATTAVDIAIQQDVFMEYAVMEQVADQMWLKLLQYEADPLLQLSILDLLERLAVIQPYHPTRSRWFFAGKDSSVSNYLLRLAGGNGDAEPDALLGGPALRVVAALCPHVPLIVAEANTTDSSHEELWPSFLKVLHIWSDLQADRLVLVQAISSLASTSEDALQHVLDDAVVRQSWLSLRRSSQSKYKAAVLVSVAQVLEPSLRHDHGGAPQLSNGNLLFAAVGTSNDESHTMDLLMSMVQSPLEEIRMGVWTLMHAMAEWSPPRGAQVLLWHENMLPLVLERSPRTPPSGYLRARR